MRGRAAAGIAFALACVVLAAQERAPLRYRIDPNGSELRWELPATLHTVRGTAPEVSGTIEADPSGPGWRIRGRIAARAGSMVTGNRSRDRTMREEILEAAQYPEIVFEARRLAGELSEFRPGAHLTVEVSGELSIRGTALPVKLPVDVRVLPGHALLSGSFSLSWKEYGLKDPSFGPIRVREPVRVVFRLRAIPL